MRKDFRFEIELPENVNASIDGRKLTVNGPKGSLERLFPYTRISMKIQDNKIVLEVKNGNKRDKTMLGTYRAHIKNMIKGVTNGFVYKLKIVSTHFPMSVSVSGNELIVKNFFGEKHPRRLKLYDDVKVTVKGDEIIVEGIDKERVGQQAANIEQLTRIKDKDPRVFQDGIYIVQKDEKVLVKAE